MGEEVLVVDSARLRWLVGLAGEDSPELGDSHQSPAAQWQRPDPTSERAFNWERFDRYVALKANDLDGSALFSVPIFDDWRSRRVLDIACHVLSSAAPGPIQFVHYELQELLLLYASGRTTGLAVSLSGGAEATVLGVWEGVLLPETAVSLHRGTHSGDHARRPRLSSRVIGRL
jgi:hypothetical protein